MVLNLIQKLLNVFLKPNNEVLWCFDVTEYSVNNDTPKRERAASHSGDAQQGAQGAQILSYNLYRRPLLKSKKCDEDF